MTTELVSNQVLTQLYREHHSWLLGWLAKRVQCRLQAEDHAHDAFMRVIASKQIDEIQEPRAFLTTIAKGLLINHWRKAAIEQAYLDRIAAYPEALIPSPEENAIILATLQEIDQLLDQLPAKVRKAFLMSQLDGLTYIEIGRQLDVTDRMVKKYMARAMLHLLTTAC
ncbi:sigma-70 family RNA polymerase sigma factor [Methylomonas methanica]|uniref:RNA polymerase, sigma-24 subunit, ECF subfamily n=1 Tax=Methylomonas methanica (strain DSM 25384 / MC09) TaxID=857087 RepID=F9ZZ94_METMM|nr:sigma-70 family RNA polymerase sigma factor [Methylomonas methanica]AEG01120.1 RNA polymerase, sigma-24 subunit, ECF subfamily [Methylomonas methanica MC09]